MNSDTQSRFDYSRQGGLDIHPESLAKIALSEIAKGSIDRKFFNTELTVSILDSILNSELEYSMNLIRAELKKGLALNYDEDDVDIFYAYGAAWAGWIQANTSDWNAIAQVSKVKNLMEWVEGYDEGYDNATVQVYLGVLTTQLPPSVGGKPEIGKAHFEKAIALSDGKHLMAKVLYAKQYARLMFEQELHDELLQQVIDADPYAEGLTLINRLAQRQADRLLAESADYFE